MVVNTSLRENPQLQRMPKNEQEWVHYQNEMAKWVLAVAKLGDGSLTTSGGTTIDGLTEIPGILVGGEALPTVNAFNKSSVQNVSTLTASDAGGSATIAIAAHNVVYDNGTVAYNSGSITGLAFSTQYYVYTDDPTKAGGAVTYASSVTSTDSVANTGRYYLGSITTGVAQLTGNISAITKASPTIITTSAVHGFTTGFIIDIADIVDDLPGGDIESTFNGQQYTITVTDTTNFTVPENSTGLSDNWASGGTAIRAATSPSGGYGGGGGSGDDNLP